MSLTQVVQRLLAQPTAPFHEEAVRAQVRRELEGLPHVELVQDDFGNLIAHYKRGRIRARWAFAAHMDHPGYVNDPGGGERVFLGGVPESYRAAGPAVEEFGEFAMWALPACELRDGRVYSRACDDLIGCAVIVGMMQELERTGAQASVYGVFTRAEEVGFVGAIELARSGRIPKAVRFVSLETSSERGGACTMGAGVIVRVGDRTSIFDSESTAALVECAQREGITFQRALMSGGTCEASAYQLYGYTTAALCVGLGNYHNCGEADRIEPEYVAVSDVEAMWRLCCAAAVAGPSDPLGRLRERLEAGVEKHRRFTEPHRSA